LNRVLGRTRQKNLVADFALSRGIEADESIILQSKPVRIKGYYDREVIRDGKKFIVLKDLDREGKPEHLVPFKEEFSKLTPFRQYEYDGNRLKPFVEKSMPEMRKEGRITDPEIQAEIPKIKGYYDREVVRDGKKFIVLKDLDREGKPEHLVPFKEEFSKLTPFRQYEYDGNTLKPPSEKSLSEMSKAVSKVVGIEKER
jgi:hypothetical protein